MSRCEAILESGQLCNSNLKITNVRVEDPNKKFSKTLSICQKCSDMIYGPMDALLRTWLNRKDVDWDLKTAEISKIRYRNCRNCHHDLSCKCNDPTCQNKFDEIWHIIFYSFTGKFRQDFQLHRRCAFLKMRQLGMLKELEIVNNQVPMENFFDIKTNPPPVTIPLQSNRQIPAKRYCKIHDIWLSEKEYQYHMQQHYKESSTDGQIEKQFIGTREKKVEAIVCMLHSRHAIKLQSGEWSCPILGCTEDLKKRMISEKDDEDYLICLFHQCKIQYDVNTGKMKCQNQSCDKGEWLRRSYLLSMVKDGYIEHRGEKVPIDIEARTVILSGQKIILKI